MLRDLIDELHLRLAKRICPGTHRLLEVEDHVTDPDVIRSDLIRGGDALARGWGCDPAILYNAAAALTPPSAPGKGNEKMAFLLDVVK